MSGRVVVLIQVEEMLDVLGLSELSDSEILRHLIEIVNPEEVLDGAKWTVWRDPACLPGGLELTPRFAS